MQYTIAVFIIFPKIIKRIFFVSRNLQPITASTYKLSSKLATDAYGWDDPDPNIDSSGLDEGLCGLFLLVVSLLSSGFLK